MPDPAAPTGPIDPRDPEARATQTTAVVLLAVIAVVLVGWALHATRIVTMPLAFAFFVVALVYPVEERLESWMPARLRWVSVVATMSLVLLVLAAGAALVWWSVQAVAAEAPAYVDRLQGMWDQTHDWLRSRGVPISDAPFAAEPVQTRVADLVATAIAWLYEMVGFLALVIFLALLMLLEARRWRAKTRAALEDRNARKVLDTVDAVGDKVRQYVLAQAGLAAMTAILDGVWLWVLDVRFVIAFGIVIFLLNLVPTIGSILAVIPPTLFALVDRGLTGGLLTLAGLTVIDTFIGNYLGPRVQGRALSVSPVIVLLSILFWGWIWGAVGALLGVPLTVSLLIVCAHVDALKPIARLLARTSDEEEVEAATEAEDL